MGNTTRHAVWVGVLLAHFVTTMGCGCGRTEVVSAYPETFVGVGLELKIAEGNPVVVRTHETSPASTAGILPGDRVIEIEGEPTDGLSLGDVVMRLRGRPSTQVGLTLNRRGQR